MAEVKKTSDDIDDVLKTLKAWKGPVFVGVLFKDEIAYIKAYKNDLVAYLLSLKENNINDQCYLTITEGNLYLDNNDGE